MAEVVIARPFCGPPASANGGYACGLVAGLLDGRAQVTLRAPPPLDRPLAVRREGPRASLWDDEVLVAEGEVVATALAAPPAPAGPEEAARAADRYEWRHEHPYPTCFVCGPRRAPGDGLRIFPRAGHGPRRCTRRRGGRATTWPGPTAPCGPSSAWAALDCPSGIVTNTFGRVGRVLLGSPDGRAPPSGPRGGGPRPDRLAGAARRPQAPHGLGALHGGGRAAGLGGGGLDRGRAGLTARPRGGQPGSAGGSPTAASGRWHQWTSCQAPSL